MELKHNQRRIIEALYREMRYLLSVYAQSKLRDRSMAEESVQDTFIIACVKAEKLLLSPNPKGWLVNTLKNDINNPELRKCISSMNRNTRQLEMN